MGLCAVVATCVAVALGKSDTTKGIIGALAGAAFVATGVAGEEINDFSLDNNQLYGIDGLSVDTI